MTKDVEIKANFNVAAKSKKDIIKTIVDKSIELNILKKEDRSTIIEAFLDREDKGTTGLVDGYAIPHAEHEKIREPLLLILRLENSIDWESMDGEPVNYIFSILVPTKDKGTAHLKILSDIAKMLMKDEAKDKLSTASSEEDILTVIDQFTSIK